MSILGHLDGKKLNWIIIGVCVFISLFLVYGVKRCVSSVMFEPMNECSRQDVVDKMKDTFRVYAEGSSLVLTESAKIVSSDRPFVNVCEANVTIKRKVGSSIKVTKE
jgi:hypothetical protein